MTDYVSNTPISVPLYLPGVSADVDLNGVKFSYNIGMFFTPASALLQLTLPPPFEGGPG